MSVGFWILSFLLSQGLLGMDCTNIADTPDGKEYIESNRVRNTVTTPSSVIEVQHKQDFEDIVQELEALPNREELFVSYTKCYKIDYMHFYWPGTAKSLLEFSLGGGKGPEIERQELDMILDVLLRMLKHASGFYLFSWSTSAFLYEPFERRLYLSGRQLTKNPGTLWSHNDIPKGRLTAFYELMDHVNKKASIKFNTLLPNFAEMFEAAKQSDENYRLLLEALKNSIVLSDKLDNYWYTTAENARGDPRMYQTKIDGGDFVTVSQKEPRFMQATLNDKRTFVFYNMLGSGFLSWHLCVKGANCVPLRGHPVAAEHHARTAFLPAPSSGAYDLVFKTEKLPRAFVDENVVYVFVVERAAVAEGKTVQVHLGNPTYPHVALCSRDNHLEYFSKTPLNLANYGPISTEPDKYMFKGNQFSDLQQLAYTFGNAGACGDLLKSDVRLLTSDKVDMEMFYYFYEKPGSGLWPLFSLTALPHKENVITFSTAADPVAPYVMLQNRMVPIHGLPDNRSSLTIHYDETVHTKEITVRRFDVSVMSGAPLMPVAKLLQNKETVVLYWQLKKGKGYVPLLSKPTKTSALLDIVFSPFPDFPVLEKVQSVYDGMYVAHFLSNNTISIFAKYFKDLKHPVKLISNLNIPARTTDISFKMENWPLFTNFTLSQAKKTSVVFASADVIVYTSATNAGIGKYLLDDYKVFKPKLKSTGTDAEVTLKFETVKESSWGSSATSFVKMNSICPATGQATEAYINVLCGSVLII